METAKSIGRTIALLLLAQMAAYWVVQGVLLGPVFSAPGFLENAAAHPTRMGLAALIGLAPGALSVAIAITALPLIRRYSGAMAYWFLALTVVAFALAAVESTTVLSLLSLSQAYAAASPADADLFQSLRGVVAASRNWTHYTGLIVAAGVAFTLYGVLYRFALIPRVLAAFGVLAALSQMISVALPLFGHKVIFLMIYPLALCHLALMYWLLAKGFAEQRETPA